MTFYYAFFMNLYLQLCDFPHKENSSRTLFLNEIDKGSIYMELYWLG